MAAAAAGPAGIAAIPALAAAKQMAQSTTGIIQGFEQWAAKPFFSNQTTTTVTHTARNQDLITRTKTHGFAISNGMIFGVLVMIAVWEMLNQATQVFGSALGAELSDVEAIAKYLNPADWPQMLMTWYDGKGNQHQSTVSVPPTFMSAVNQFGVQTMLPFLAAAQQFGTQGTGFVGKYLTPGGNE